jgi:RHS repeat-associated protein
MGSRVAVSSRRVHRRIGAIQEQSDYFPFGGEVVVAGSDTNSYKFTGKQRDTETGLDNFGARYYASGFGRFMSPDKPLADQHAAAPQSWNLYSYARNSPLRFVDDDGERVIETLVYKPYDVHGKTAAEAHANALAVAPVTKTAEGEAMTGETTSAPLKITHLVVQPSVSGFEGTFVTATETLKSADVELKQTIIMPNWVESPKASPKEQAAWETALTELKEHEEGHALINREQAEKLDRTLPGTSATAGAPNSTDAYKKAGARLTQRLNQEVRGNNAENNTRQEEYDKHTDHGRNQHGDENH